MSSCCCSLAGTAACRTCCNNPNAETPGPVRTNTIIASGTTMVVGQRTNADRIRSMTDEELAAFMTKGCDNITIDACKRNHDCAECWLDWLKEEAEGASI